MSILQRQPNAKKWSSLLASVCLTAFCSISHASAIFTNSSDFHGSLSNPSSIINFDSVDAQTLLPNDSVFGELNYSLSSGRDFVISDNFSTTSGLNYLGADDGFSNEFLSGEEITFSFDGLINAFGLYVFALPDDIFANDFQLVGGGQNVFNTVISDQRLDDGAEAYFLGISSDVGFSEVRLNSFGDTFDPFFAFNVDDIVFSSVAEVPTPPVFASFGLAGLFLLFRKTFKTKSLKQI